MKTHCKFLLVAISLFFCIRANSQSNKLVLSKNNFSDVKPWLIASLKELKESYDSSLFVVGISNNFTYPIEFNQVEFRPGIYKFGANYSHAKTFILLVTNNSSQILAENDPLKIIEDVIKHIRILKINNMRSQLEIINDTVMALR